MLEQYLALGITHVLPLGFDHIVFILCLYLLNPSMRSVLIQCSLFTLAHSITLGLTASGLIIPDTMTVEVLIAASILFTAVENILSSSVSSFRLVIIFLFGLIHGMGFAGALKEIGIPKSDFLVPLISFNLGVELGQLSVILIAWFCIGYWFSRKQWYRTRIVIPVSTAIGCLSVYWIFDRLALLS